MDLAIRTTKGTDPLRPEFGSNVYKFVDYPVNVAVPNVKKELVEALQLWVPEIKIVSIRHTFERDFNPIFEITYQVVDEGIIDKLLFDLTTGSTTVTDAVNEIILQAFFPPNPNSYRYKIKLEKNGNEIAPMPPAFGFTSIDELFTWVQNNWFYVGRWYRLVDKIICYMNSEGVTSASLSIEVLPIIRFEADFPQLPPGALFKVLFTANGNSAIPAMPETFNNPGDVLAFAQSNWNKYGAWGIEYLQESGDAIFSDEFSDEFAITSTGYKLVGVSNIEDFVGDLQILIA